MKTPGQIVKDFIEALNNEDFDTARQYVTDDMRFIGVMGSRDGADAYFTDMRHMKFKYDIKKVFTDDNDVCLFYDIDMNGTNVFCCGWYHLQHNKIAEFRVIFDPRPILK